MESLHDPKGIAYLKALKDRSRTSRAYQKHQLIGLEIAEILHDEKHIALYIKLAKNHGSDALLMLAKDVARKKNVKNYGAYFMRLVTNSHAAAQTKKQQ